MTPRLYKSRDPHGKLHVWQVGETTPVPDDPRRLTHAWLREHAVRVAAKLWGDEWSYKCPGDKVWKTGARVDFDRMREVGR